MEKINGMAKWFYNFLKCDKWHFLAFVGAFLIIFCTKQLNANEVYFYDGLTAESKAEFLKTSQTISVSTWMWGYTFRVNCKGKWVGSKFDTSYNSKPHVLGNFSSIRDEDKATVINTINGMC